MDKLNLDLTANGQKTSPVIGLTAPSPERLGQFRIDTSLTQKIYTQLTIQYRPTRDGHGTQDFGSGGKSHHFKENFYHTKLKNQMISLKQETSIELVKELLQTASNAEP